MSETPGPIHEIAFGVRGSDASAVDDRLEVIVDELTRQAGFAGIEVWALEDADETDRRVIRFAFADDAHWRVFMGEQADAIRARLAAVAGDGTDISERTLRGTEVSGAIEPPRCLNCDRILTGQYCGGCGQRGQSRLISLVELVKDAFGDLFELDSRLWQTLIPLAIRPGVLTRDYLQGRRARYMPPFRMYLVLSLAFFVIAFFDPYRDLGLLFAPEDSGTATTAVPEEDSGVRLRFGDYDNDDEDPSCEFDSDDVADMPQWLSRRLTPERLQAVCLEIFEDGGAGMNAVFGRFVENIPAGLFILLPVMALVLKLLYPLSRRYYVEHLLFVLHYHAFVFLVLTVDVLLSRLIGWLTLPDGLAGVIGFAVAIYIPVYLYKALRRVYGQGHLLTALKFCMLSACYLVGLVCIIVVAGLLAAFSS